MTPPDDARPRRGRKLSAEERELWRGVARSLRPLRRGVQSLEESAARPEILAKSDVTACTVAKPTPKPVRPPTSKVSASIANKPPIAPLARRERRHIARGKIALDAKIDLHGLTQADAHGVLFRFLRRAQADGCRIVLVITGKGSRDGERGVLRRQVPLWLALPEFRLVVSQFDVADIAHGGEGALYVRLKRTA